ncbi:DUF6415 family natural product biosynthesis protein [Streptomyces mirabilis]|uniref:DUF6415 family natural product biosynthesis protein n=1 Tax=Streptomyces mirabilis TaxID=68239 RepID=UPI0036EE4D18
MLGQLERGLPDRAPAGTEPCGSQRVAVAHAPSLGCHRALSRPWPHVATPRPIRVPPCTFIIALWLSDAHRTRQTAPLRQTRPRRLRILQPCAPLCAACSPRTQLPSLEELETLTLQLRGHIALLIPEVEATAGCGSEITTTGCRDCGAEVHGLNGRYACGLCGWVNHWSQGDTELPGAEDDPDFPGR